MRGGSTSPLWRAFKIVLLCLAVRRDHSFRAKYQSHGADRPPFSRSRRDTTYDSAPHDGPWPESRPRFRLRPRRTAGGGTIPIARSRMEGGSASPLRRASEIVLLCPAVRRDHHSSLEKHRSHGSLRLTNPDRPQHKGPQLAPTPRLRPQSVALTMAPSPSPGQGWGGG